MSKKKTSKKAQEITSKPLLNAVPSYTISQKKVTKIYNAVADEIMDARIAISKITDKKTYDQIDVIMHRLQMIAPEMAIGELRRNSI